MAEEHTRRERDNLVRHSLGEASRNPTGGTDGHTRSRNLRVVCSNSKSTLAGLDGAKQTEELHHGSAVDSSTRLEQASQSVDRSALNKLGEPVVVQNEETARWS